MANSELRNRVETVLRTEVAPTFEIDGSTLEVLGVEHGCARVRLNGACAGCPATVMFLIRGMEEELRKHIPEVVITMRKAGNKHTYLVIKLTQVLVSSAETAPSGGGAKPQENITLSFGKIEVEYKEQKPGGAG